MFVFPRRLHPAAVRGRACYSSFFSNKAGGGRYFSPAKPPKPSSGKDASSSSSPDAVPADSAKASSTSSHGSNPSSSNDHVPMKVQDQQTCSAPTSTSSHDSPHAQPATTSPSTPSFPVAYHIPVDSKDFKLHQFFSLHRPLLLLSHPTSTLFDLPQSLSPTNPFSSLFTSTDPDSGRPPVFPTTIDNPPESSPEADADTARQLARALVLNRVGGTVAWESTLHRLGIDLTLDEDRAMSKEQCEKEWKEVMMESTRRKRRSKMKKHKLKKRRRATRAQRLRIGR